MTASTTIAVNLGERSYEVRVAPGSLRHAAEHIGGWLKRGTSHTPISIRRPCSLTGPPNREHAVEAEIL